VILARARVRWLVLRLDRNFYPFCDFRHHSVKNIEFFDFTINVVWPGTFCPGYPEVSRNGRKNSGYSL
jgi:hypothetical protein